MRLALAALLCLSGAFLFVGKGFLEAQQPQKPSPQEMR